MHPRAARYESGLLQTPQILPPNPVPHAYLGVANDSPDRANVDAAANRTGSITGTVLDATGAVVSGANVQLTESDESVVSTAVTDKNGQFSFLQVPIGAFHLTVTSPGFVT
ncbi:MAG: carboxypeptidase-like regulatory domain-containing protein [Candidatus Acidiferrales bacterium]